jgi:hypothetical protein
MKKVLFLFGILVSMIVFAAAASALDIYCGNECCGRSFSWENDCYCEDG